MKIIIPTILVCTLLMACSTPTYTLENPKTKQVVLVGGSATGSLAGGMIGHEIAKSNDLKKIEQLKKEGFVLKDVKK